MLHDPRSAGPHRPRAPHSTRRRAFYDKRVSQEVDGECLGEVRQAAEGRAAASSSGCGRPGL